MDTFGQWLHQYSFLKGKKQYHQPVNLFTK
jgi:hypothetical protein